MVLYQIYEDDLEMILILSFQGVSNSLFALFQDISFDSMRFGENFI